MTLYYYKRDGSAYTGPDAIMDWVKDFQDMKIKRVAEDILPNGYRVSTVWLGLDHGFGGKPLIFETMVFQGDYVDLDTDRYSTEEEAFEGHKKMVEKWEQK